MTYKFTYRTAIGKSVFVYEGHMSVWRKITTWQRCAYQFSFTSDSINRLIVGVRYVKSGANVNHTLLCVKNFCKPTIKKP